MLMQTWEQNPSKNPPRARTIDERSIVRAYVENDRCEQDRINEYGGRK
jgi:hypothetical protein